MNDKPLNKIFMMSLLLILFVVLAACGAEEPTEITSTEEVTSEKPVTATTSQPPGFYVWTDTGENDNWETRITIPRQEECVKIIVNTPISDDEMSELNDDGSAEYQATKKIINFCVALFGEEDCSDREFSPPMKIETKKDEPCNGEILLYQDGKGEGSKWQKFAEQGTKTDSHDLETCTGWAEIINWPADPQVAWGK